MYSTTNANDVMRVTQERALTLQRFESDVATQGFDLTGRLPPVTDPTPERVATVPPRGARFEPRFSPAWVQLIRAACPINPMSQRRPLSP